MATLPRLERAKARALNCFRVLVMWHSQIRPERVHFLRISQKARKQAGWESEDLGLDALVVEGDVPGHGRSIAYPLCTLSRAIIASGAEGPVREMAKATGGLARGSGLTLLTFGLPLVSAQTGRSSLFASFLAPTLHFSQAGIEFNLHPTIANIVQ